MVYFNETTWHYMPEDCHLQLIYPSVLSNWAFAPSMIIKESSKFESEKSQLVFSSRSHIDLKQLYCLVPYIWFNKS
jgi:hypothetical protein